MQTLSNNLSEDKRELLLEIRSLYGQHERANESLKSYFSGAQDLAELQEALLAFVVGDPVLSKHKPYWKYRQSFLKCVIGLVEHMQEEVNEALFNSYIQLISSEHESRDEEKYFLTFFSNVFLFKQSFD